MEISSGKREKFVIHDGFHEDYAFDEIEMPIESDIDESHKYTIH